MKLLLTSSADVERNSNFYLMQTRVEIHMIHIFNYQLSIHINYINYKLYNQFNSKQTSYLLVLTFLHIYIYLSSKYNIQYIIQYGYHDLTLSL